VKSKRTGKVRAIVGAGVVAALATVGMTSAVGAAQSSDPGVSAKEIKLGYISPETGAGAPVGLADDPLKGVQTYLDVINETGGVNGRKVVHKVFDDRYTVSGATTAKGQAINDYKPFFVSGTLGVDQIYQVAAEARKRNVPYIAGGGSESIFKDISMFQVSGSYDTHLILLADFLAAQSKKQGSMYFGRKKIGVSALDSPYIAPSVDSFKKELEKNGLSLVKVVKVQHPTQQTSYASQIQALKDAGTEIFVPAQDPITTSRELQECVSQACTWAWSVSDFAHESDTALKLMGGTWAGVRGLSGSCYYVSENAYNPQFCGAMNKAHEEWVAMDQDKEDGWKKDGQGGASGYQIVHIWLTALRSLGADPTREKFVAALNNQENFSDLISSPITYKGSSNIAHGAEGMVVFEAQTNLTWKQLTPGFVSSF